MHRLALGYQRGPVACDATRSALAVQQAAESDRSLNVGVAAALLGVDHPAVTAAIRRGRLPAVKVDGRWTIQRADLEIYRKESRGHTGNA
jgi:excisionase family DNA binding protein